LYKFADSIVENIGPPRFVSVSEGKFEGCAGKMGVKNIGIFDRDDGWLGRALEELGGMMHEPLVKLIVAGDEDGKRLLGGATSATSLLPHRRDRSGKAVQNAGIKSADIDA
jgi:hypothetical protein